MAQPNAQMQLVLDHFAKFGAPPLDSLDSDNARKLPTLKNAVEEIMSEHLLARAATLVKPNPPHVARIAHRMIPRPGGEVLARIYRPQGESVLPILIYFHGGGWVIAGPDVYDASCRALCHTADCIVVSVAYRQAPEHKFPEPVEDAYAALQWVIAHAAELGGDPARVAIGGESAGGNLATVACLKAVREGGRLPAVQLLIYPVTDTSMKQASYGENADAKPLSAAMMPWFWKHYLESESQGREPYASPMLAERLAGLPPAIVITAENDPLRDEGEAYARRLAEDGVSVSSQRFDGVMHEFFGLAGAVSKAADAVKFAAEELRKTFDAREGRAATR